MMGWNIIKPGCNPSLFPFSTHLRGLFVVSAISHLQEDGVFLAGRVGSWRCTGRVWDGQERWSRGLWVGRRSSTLWREAGVWEACFREKGIVIRVIVVVYLALFHSFIFCFFKLLKSRTNVIFQQLLLFIGLCCCSNIPQKQEAYSDVTKDSEITFACVNPNVMVYRFFVPQTPGPI